VPFPFGGAKPHAVALLGDMEIVIWKGRAAATVDIDETRLAPQIEVLEVDHPDRRFVCVVPVRQLIQISG
jgi:hypothetical protein